MEARRKFDAQFKEGAVRPPVELEAAYYAQRQRPAAD